MLFHMFEVDFDTGLVDMNKVSRHKLNNQCSDNADRYVCFGIRDVESLTGEAPHLMLGSVYERYLDMEWLCDNTLVIHVLDGRVCAATIITSHECGALRAWLGSGNMAGFQQTLKAVI